MTAIKLKTPKIPTPPAHLQAAGASHWREVLSEFDFATFDLPMLQAACEQLDRATEARVIIAKEGVTTTDRFDQVKEHPAVAVERAAHLAFVRIMRELALQQPPADTRPPLSRGYR